MTNLPEIEVPEYWNVEYVPTVDKYRFWHDDYDDEEGSGDWRHGMCATFAAAIEEIRQITDEY